MPTNDLPKGTVSGDAETLTFDEGVSALEDLLSDPSEDPGSGKNPAKTTQSKAKAEDDEDDDDADDGEQPEDDVEDDDTDEDVDPDDEDDEEDDEETDDEGDPRDAVELADDTVIDLGNGQKATLADLKQDFGNVQKRVADFQRHFTQRTTEVAEYEKKLRSAEDKVVAAAQEVRQHRELIYAYAQAYMPQPPERPELAPAQDPIGWMEYEARKEDYENHRQYVQRIQHAQRAQEAKAKAEREAMMPKVIAGEVQKLHERHPRLKDPEVAQRTIQNLYQVFEKAYGITPQEIAQVYDHRTMSVMLDALAFRELDAKKAKVSAKIKDKPAPRKVLRASGRQSKEDQDRHGAKTRLKRLRETGSLDAAAESLMDFTGLFD